MKTLPHQAFLALDLEFNQPSGRIIQVGVAVGGRLQSEEEYVVRQWLLAPGEPLHPDIVTLTGITEERLDAHAVPWSQMVAELTALIAEREPFVNPVTWGGGDAEALLTGIRVRGLEFPHFGRRWVDVKTWHTLTALAKGKNPSGGLRSVMAQYGMRFEGTPHRADADAFNTLRLFFRLLERQASFETMALLGRRV